jgi:ATP-binding cassette subfamily G (WHITE) protein 2 (PDR)
MITVEMPWQILVATLSFFCWYYPVGLYNNAAYTNEVTQRGGLMYFYVLLFFIYTSTMAQMAIAGMELGDAAANVASLTFTMALLFCGALATPQALPGFWIFMYRVSPFTYMMTGMLTVGLANSPVVCAVNEFLYMDAPSGLTCGEYLAPYIKMAGGLVQNPDATSMCQFCTTTTTNTFLESISAPYSDRWRNLGIFIVYPVFHIAMAFFLYWLNRVPKKKDRVKRK